MLGARVLILKSVTHYLKHNKFTQRFPCLGNVDHIPCLICMFNSMKFIYAVESSIP